MGVKMSNTELAKGIYWVGAIDWDVRDFHGYSTYKGTTYNAFLIVDKKVTLFDTVKRSHLNELLDNIRAIIDPAKIDYLVVNHVEMDHSGSLPAMMDIIKPEKLFCSPMGQKAIVEHFHREDWPYEVVKSGSEVSLGKRTIQFLETRMLHWPDSMFSYIKEDGILFSSDAFGQHYATSERFDDEVDISEVMQESSKYYANILYLFSPLIRKLLASVKEMAPANTVVQSRIYAGSCISSTLFILALSQLDVSVLTPLFSFRTVFAVILGALFLNEVLTTHQYLLVAIIFVFGLFVSVDEKFSLRSKSLRAPP